MQKQIVKPIFKSNSIVSEITVETVTLLESKS